MRYLIIMSLILTDCGQAITNVKTQFKLDGVELMETTKCVWNEVGVNGSLTMKEYSDGSVDKMASMSAIGLVEYHTLPFNDQPSIYYVYRDSLGNYKQGALVDDGTVCKHEFYNYK